MLNYFFFSSFSSISSSISSIPSIPSTTSIPSIPSISSTTSISSISSTTSIPSISSSTSSSSISLFSTSSYYTSFPSSCISSCSSSYFYDFQHPTSFLNEEYTSVSNRRRFSNEKDLNSLYVLNNHGSFNRTSSLISNPFFSSMNISSTDNPCDFSSSLFSSSLLRNSTHLLSFPDNYTQVEKFKKFANSKLTIQRILCVQDSVEACHAAGFSSFSKEIFPSLKALAKDSVSYIRYMLTCKMSDIAGFLIQSEPEEGYVLSLQILLPMIKNLILDSSIEVGRGAIDALVMFSTHLRAKDRNDLILPIALSMANNLEDSNARCIGAILLIELSEFLGDFVTRSFVLPQIHCLSEDVYQNVRLAVASNIHELSRVVGEEIAGKKVMQIYRKLCTDDFWCVRKMCADNLTNFTHTVSLVDRINSLESLLRMLLKDENLHVRESAKNQLGLFITMLEHEKNVSDFLFFKFIDLTKCFNISQSEEVLCEPKNNELNHNENLNFSGSFLEGKNAFDKSSLADSQFSHSSSLNLKMFPSFLFTRLTDSLERDHNNTLNNSINHSKAKTSSFLYTDEYRCAFSFCGVLKIYANSLKRQFLLSTFKTLTYHKSSIIRKPIAASFDVLMKTVYGFDFLIENKKAEFEVRSPSSCFTCFSSMEFEKDVNYDSLVRHNNNDNVLLFSNNHENLKEESFYNEQMLNTKTNNEKQDWIREMCKAFDFLLFDKDLEIRYIILNNYAKVLEFISPRFHEKYLKMLNRICESSLELGLWRLRESVVTQIKSICKIVSGQKQLMRELANMTLKLCEDSVSEVRKIAAASISTVLKYSCQNIWKYFEKGKSDACFTATKNIVRQLKLEENNVKSLLVGAEVSIIFTILKRFARSPNYTQRQTFIRMCDGIIREAPRGFFELYFMRSLVLLSNDKTKNVRVLWALTMSTHIKSSGRYAKNALLVCAGQSMSLSDSDSEVRKILRNLNNLSDDSLESVDGLDVDDLNLFLGEDKQRIVRHDDNKPDTHNSLLFEANDEISLQNNIKEGNEESEEGAVTEEANRYNMCDLLANKETERDGQSLYSDLMMAMSAKDISSKLKSRNCNSMCDIDGFMAETSAKDEEKEAGERRNKNCCEYHEESNFEDDFLQKKEQRINIKMVFDRASYLEAKEMRKDVFSSSNKSAHCFNECITEENEESVVNERSESFYCNCEGETREEVEKVEKVENGKEQLIKEERKEREEEGIGDEKEEGIGGEKEGIGGDKKGGIGGDKKGGIGDEEEGIGDEEEGIGGDKKEGIGDEKEEGIVGDKKEEGIGGDKKEEGIGGDKKEEGIGDDKKEEKEGAKIIEGKEKKCEKEKENEQGKDGKREKKEKAKVAKEETERKSEANIMNEKEKSEYSENKVIS